MRAYNHAALTDVPSFDDPQSHKPGQIGPYEILAEIGRGGMGIVYRARDTRLRRDVALKVLHASRDDQPRRLQRFLEEARAAGALKRHCGEVGRRR